MILASPVPDYSTRPATARGRADLAVVNARVITLDPHRPRAEAVAVRGDRIQAVGTLRDLRHLIGPATEVVDAQGSVVVPSFHDAHMHLLSYARSLSRLDCRGLQSIGALNAALAAQACRLPPGTWVRAVGYDETLLAEARHPSRRDLDDAVSDHPVRLQHRSLHLDVLNTPALRLLGLMDTAAAGVEHDPATGEPTGRLHHAGELLRERLEHPSERELGLAVRAASRALLARGVTTVQDASVTNSAETWELFRRLAASGDLGVRVFLMPGIRHWRAVIAAGPPGPMVRRGPVKIMLDEGKADPAEVRAQVAAVRAAGEAVALHAVSEAEVAVALDALQAARPTTASGPDRIEHGAVIPDAWLGDLRAAGVAVVGQPSLVYERGDVYRAEYSPDLQTWLHRAGSLVAAGVLYAAGSDAPVTDPNPGIGIFAARRRRTRSGAFIGPDEALGPLEALAAFTAGPAEVVGVASELGRLRAGALADLAVVDDDLVAGTSIEGARCQARLTIMAGRVVWRRPS
ncbi:MAG: amidohydrolase family protein [Chloroflexi bacterium]|nr:amidohydrolase family protein [Chloroflexota bacterium]